MISVKLEQPSNADEPINVRLFVLSINWVNDVQFLNVLFGMLEISLYIFNFLIPKNTLFSIISIDGGSLISSNEEQPSNAEDPIDIRELLLMYSLVKEEQFLNVLLRRCVIFPFTVNIFIPWNAFSPIFWIDAGNSISLNDVHP